MGLGGRLRLRPLRLTRGFGHRSRRLLACPGRHQLRQAKPLAGVNGKGRTNLIRGSEASIIKLKRHPDDQRVVIEPPCTWFDRVCPESGRSPQGPRGDAGGQETRQNEHSNPST